MVTAKIRKGKEKQLIDEGLIEKGRGYGGSVVLVQNTDKEIEESHAAIIAERPLYAPVMAQLEARWAKEWDLSQAHFEITAHQGRRETGGSWSRPDIIGIGYKKYEFLPDKSVEIFSFEIKPSNDVSIKGVMEALAHREAATRSYVIYHTANREFSEYAEAERIEELAARHGIGVYAAKNERLRPMERDSSGTKGFA